MRLSISIPAFVATVLALSGNSSAFPVQNVAPSADTTPGVPETDSTNIVPLARFYILWYQVSFSFLPSIVYDASGEFGKCQDLPTLFRDNVGSIKFTSNTPSCWVYPTLGCGGDTFQDIKAPGTMVFDGPAKSFVCDIPKWGGNGVKLGDLS